MPAAASSGPEPSTSFKLPGFTPSRKNFSHPYLGQCAPRKALTELQAEAQPLERFPEPSSQEELSELCKPFVPARTQVNNRWALSVFTKWLAARNSRVTDSKDMFPTNLLEVSHPCATIDVVLAAFVFEARRADGNYYPGTTIKHWVMKAILLRKSRGSVIIQCLRVP